jgi:hypothetical protein
MVQGHGVALRLSQPKFEEALVRVPGLRAVLLRYTRALYAQALQTAACNGRHGAEQRLAR